jgi:hypothetical protein
LFSIHDALEQKEPAPAPLKHATVTKALKPTFGFDGIAVFASTSVSHRFAPEV